MKHLRFLTGLTLAPTALAAFFWEYSGALDQAAPITGFWGFEFPVVMLALFAVGVGLVVSTSFKENRK